MADPAPPTIHRDPELFGEAVRFTAATTGFGERLIVKDYFCTVLLAELAQRQTSNLVFKGGTCLAKVHIGFHRLSEDLDFVIPHARGSARRARRTAIEPVRAALSDICRADANLSLAVPLTGANESKQYNGSIEYRWPGTGEPDRVLVEIGVREPLLRPTTVEWARTLLRDPFRDAAAVPPIAISCIDLDEALAEKVRAALTRREVAIRDFFDLLHVSRTLKFRSGDPALLALIRSKLDVPGTPPFDLSEERIAALRRQVAARLRPVLRPTDFAAFDLDESIELVRGIAERVAGGP